MIKLNLSKDNFFQKPTSTEIAKMQFIYSELTLEALSSYISLGYSYCGLFNSKSSTLTVKEKTNSNWIGSQIVTIDCDNSKLSLEECLEVLTYTPNIAYYTFSNNKCQANNNGIYKFRLVYVFDNVIEDGSMFQKISTIINNQFTNDTEQEFDKASFKLAQYFNGSDNSNIINNVLFNISNFNISNNNIKLEVTNKKCQPNNNENNNRNTLLGTFSEEIDKQFYSDYSTLSFSEFKVKYEQLYNYIEETNVDFNNELIIDIPTEYKKFCKKYNIETKNYKIVKGSGKRYKTLVAFIIFTNNVINNISLEHLISNTYTFFVYYIENSDMKYNRNMIANMCYKLWKKDIEFKSIDKRKKMVNKEMAKEIYGTANYAIIKAKDTRKKIEDYYNPTLSGKENIKIMVENGICSERTFKRWLKENGLQKKQQKQVQNDVKAVEVIIDTNTPTEDVRNNYNVYFNGMTFGGNYFENEFMKNKNYEVLDAINEYKNNKSKYVHCLA